MSTDKKHKESHLSNDQKGALRGPISGYGKKDQPSLKDALEKPDESEETTKDKELKLSDDIKKGEDSMNKVKVTDPSTLNLEDPKNEKAMAKYDTFGSAGRELDQKRHKIKKSDALSEYKEEKPAKREKVKKSDEFGGNMGSIAMSDEGKGFGDKFKKMISKVAKKKMKKKVLAKTDGQLPWAMKKSIEFGRTSYNALGQWELKKDEGDVRYLVNEAYLEVVEGLNADAPLEKSEAGYILKDDIRMERLIKTAICLEMNKVAKEIEALELRKNEQIGKIEALEKSLFEEPKKEIEKAPSTGENKPSREDLARDLCWKLNDLKELTDKKYCVESEYKYGEKDEKEFNKVKAALEFRYRKLKTEISELAEKFSKSRLTKSVEDDEALEKNDQLKLKDVKGSGLKRKDKKALDPDDSPKARSGRIYEGGSPVKALKAGVQMAKDKMATLKEKK